MGDSSSGSSRSQRRPPRGGDAVLAADTEARAVAQLATWGGNPEQFVLDAFGPGYLERHGEELTPDPWQKEALGALVNQPLRRFAYAASKNALKTCTLSWIVWWFLATRYDAQIIATSISGDNLKAGLWKELALWYSLSPVLQAQFEMTAEQITARDPLRKRSWWCQARAWPKDADSTQQAETLAGLHNRNIMFVNDEAGGTPDGVIAAADAIFASKGGEAYMVLAGNTVRSSGPLYRAVLNREGLYWVKRISGDPDDPTRCTRVSVQWAKEQLAQCGGDRDHPHYRVNVLGLFPLISSEKLLGPDHLDTAMKRNPQRHLWENEPVIVGIDTALQGSDQTVLVKRQGMVAFRPRKWRTTDSMVLADQLAGVLVQMKPRPTAIFIDLGGPSGHAIRDRLRQLGFRVTGVDFGSEPVGDDPAAPPFKNRRAEMAWKCAQWVKEQGALPEDPELRGDLLEPEFLPTKTGKTAFIVEPKKLIKERLGRSPDTGDALWLTFAAPVFAEDLATSAVDLAGLEREGFNPFSHLGGRRG